jgi:hypothetical protein
MIIMSISDPCSDRPTVASNNPLKESARSCLSASQFEDGQSVDHGNIAMAKKC